MNQSCCRFSGKSSIFFALILCAGTLFFSTSQAWAQADVGSISGVVSDPSGAAIAGATVKLVDPTINTALTVTTNEVGRYSFVSVPPGTYDITVTHAGFALTRVPQQKVSVGLTL